MVPLPKTQRKLQFTTEKLFRKAFYQKAHSEKPFGKESHPKLQSAMEYLMTYGWAILIIAVVLGALFQLGVFNANSFSPKAQPGACQIVRPYGPGTTTDLALEGICNGELPQYVGTFPTSTRNSVPASGALERTWFGTSWTISAWINVEATSSNSADMIEETYGCTSGIFEQPSGSGVAYTTSMAWGNAGQSCSSWGTISATSNTLPLNTWEFVTGVFYYGLPGNWVAICADDVCTNSTWTGYTPASYNTLPYNFVAGTGTTCCGGGHTLTVQMANVQLYNTSLTNTEILALYDEGIGGAPVKPQNLVVWWPLNGNANDYSGNNNNGAATAITYTGAWASQYTGPV